MDLAFEKYSIDGLELNNRLVRSAVWEALADEEGRIGDELPRLAAELARGGVGLVIIGFAFVSRNGKALPYQTGVHHDDLTPGLAKVADAVHQAGGKAVMQIAHAGYQTKASVCGDVPGGPCVLQLPGLDQKVRELSIKDIQQIVDDFGKAAQRVKSAGFDGVQLHMAHGYLLSQFLSPFLNRRGDRYGGSLLNRARISYEVYEAVRGEVGSGFPVMAKVNSEDFIKGGLTLDESLQAAANLVDMGLNAVEVSGGHKWSGRYGPVRTKISKPEDEAYFKDAGRAFKQSVQVPVILVGGFRSPAVIADILETGVADMVSLARPLIRQPDLIANWRDGDPNPAACISCNGCFSSGLKGRGSVCVVLEKETQDARR